MGASFWSDFQNDDELIVGTVSRSDIALFCGILMLIMAMVGTCTGRLPGRFGDVSSRTKDPK
jgi:hypothetical protein